MKGSFRSLPVALKVISKDPINLSLVIIPTIISLTLYLLLVVAILNNSDSFVSFLKGYIGSPESAGIVGKVLMGLLVIFVLVLMNWTFVIVVGIIAAPFNSILSDRIEKKLVQRIVENDQKKTFKKVISQTGSVLINEMQKLIFIAFLSGVAFLMNLFPLLYPVGFFLLSLLMAVQFIDYSWSRHEWNFGACLKDMSRNVIPYSVAGFCFLLLVTVPIINAFVPALATSYFTVLWLNRQNKLTAIPQL